MPPGQNDTPALPALPAVPARKPNPGRIPETVQHHAMRLLAQGRTQAQVAEALDVSVRSIARWVKLAHNATLMAETRQILRAKAVRWARRIEPKLHDLIERAIDSGDPKAADAATRAALNHEKRMASVSGETTQVPVQQDISIRIASFMRPSVQNADSATALPAAADVVDAEIGPADVPDAGGV